MIKHGAELFKNVLASVELVQGHIVQCSHTRGGKHGQHMLRLYYTPFEKRVLFCHEGKNKLCISNMQMKLQVYYMVIDLFLDIIHRIHLRGSFLVTRAAWNHMKNQKYGR